MVLDDVPFAVVSLNAGCAVKAADKADLATHAGLVRKSSASSWQFQQIQSNPTEVVGQISALQAQRLPASVAEFFQCGNVLLKNSLGLRESRHSLLNACLAQQVQYGKRCAVGVVTG